MSNGDGEADRFFFRNTGSPYVTARNTYDVGESVKPQRRPDSSNRCTVETVKTPTIYRKRGEVKCQHSTKKKRAHYFAGEGMIWNT